MTVDWNDRNRAAYSRCARIYAGDEPGEDDAAMRERFREAFASRLSGRRVLEVGCGPGVDAWKLSLRGLDVVATDITPELVAIVRERWPRLRCEVMDMTRPHLPARSFDGIYAAACFFHLPRALAPVALASLRELLDDDGVLFLHLIDSTKVREYVIEEWAGLDANPVLFTCWTQAEIRSLLEGAGFDRIELPSIPSEVYEKLPRLVERGVHGYQVIARKARGMPSSSPSLGVTLRASHDG